MKLKTLIRARAALALASAIGATSAMAQPAMENATLAITNVSALIALDFIAADMNLWAKHGLNVKIVQLSGANSINSVIAGSVEFAHASGGTLTRAAMRGQKLESLVLYLNKPFAEIVLRKELATAAGFDPKAPLARRAQVLKGRTIAVDALNTNIHAFVRVVARAGGIDPDDIRIAPMAPPEMLAAFAAKKIDGFAFTTPWVDQVVVNGTGVNVASGPNGDPPTLAPFAQSLVLAKRETCAQRPKFCQAFVDGVTEAAAFLRDHPDEAVKIVKKRMPNLDDKLLAAAIDSVRKGTPNPLAVTRASLENTDLINIQAGLMKPEDKPASYDELLTDRFVKKY